MKHHAFFAALAAAALLAGCATVESAHTFNHVRTNAGNAPVSTVTIQNTGWFFLDWLPICCGNPAAPNTHDFKFFTDTVTLENNLLMLDEKMRQESATSFANLNTQHYSESFYLMLLSRRVMHTSVVILKENPPEQNP